MRNIRTSVLRGPLILVYMGMLAFLMACSTLTAGFSNGAAGSLLIEDGVVKALARDGDPAPLAGTSTFELVGQLESVDPWIVAGRDLVTNESTQIAPGLQAGDLVRVRGAIPESGAWLAYSIEAAQEQENRTVLLIGVVTSTDPWVVNGIRLNVTGETVIEGGITNGMLVRVEILLLDDGTWEVVGIAPLGTLTETSGCATVTATVVGVSGDQVQFLGWPATVTLGEGAGANTISPGQVVLAVVCASQDGRLVISRLTVLDGDDGPDGDTTGGGDKVLVCHKPAKKGGHTLSISSSAVPAHLGHGDTLGPCP